MDEIQRWEYQVGHYEHNNAKGGGYVLDGVDFEHRTKDMREWLNAAGAAGWELLGGDGYIFKRPL